MNFSKYFLTALLIASLFTACKNDEINPDREKKEADALTQKVTTFIYDEMSTNYLWNSQIPDYDLKYETNPIDYFYNIITQLDYDRGWSFITDDIEGLLQQFEGTGLSIGYSLEWFYYDNTNNDMFAVVQFVYPRTSAAEAKLKRGDIIINLNGVPCTDQNYMEAYGKQVTVTLAHLEGNQMIPDNDVSLTAKQSELNPVNFHTVLGGNGDQKTGYLVYTDFIQNYNTELEKVFTNFQEAGIQELVLDLRYNAGGDDRALVYLCSSIAPREVVDAKKILISDQWNTDIMAYFEQTGQLETTRIRFINENIKNLNLQRIYILTSRNSFSASEATIIGLTPYMDVTLIGEQTGGKYTSSITLQPGSWKDENTFIPDREIGNWGLQPIVAQYTNSVGMGFTEGLIPKYPVEDMANFPLFQLGDPAEPMLAKALALINNEPVKASLVSRPGHHFRKSSGRYVSRPNAAQKTLRTERYSRIMK